MFCILVVIAGVAVTVEQTSYCFPSYEQCSQAVLWIAKARPVVADRVESFRCQRQERAV